MVELSKFNQEKLPEIENLRERILKLDNKPEKEATPEKAEERIKKEIKSHLQELQQVSASAMPLQLRDEADEIKKMEPNQQVGALISLVFEKGLKQAVSIAKNLDPAIQDEFHDILIDRYYAALLEQGVVNQS